MLATRLQRVLREIPIQDWLILIYLTLLPLALWVRAESPARDASMRNYLLLLSVYLVVVLLVRSKCLSHEVLAPAIYRPTTIVCTALSYSLFPDYLPQINSATLDAQLYSIDLNLFGAEPAIVMQQWVNAFTTEWFSFCYLFYFPLVYSYVLSIVLFVRSSAQIDEFTLGVLMVVCLGNLTYLLVPGRGPFYAFSHLYSTPLPDGFFWNHTRSLVRDQGAQLDIFPSLHTALPLVLTLYSWRFRRHGIHRFWWITAFFFLNIVVATMLLRWHYFIDVVAGVILATLSHTISAKISTWETRTRQSKGLMPIYPEWRKAD